MTPAADIDTLAEGVRGSDRRALAKAITLIESSNPTHRQDAEALLNAIAAPAEPCLRIGVTGAPGVGKSTFIEALGMHAVDAGHRVAVLSIDPSSRISGGAILGDKTRMENLSRRREAFIRPSAAGATLGGTHRRTRESILVVEAGGFDTVIIETVGIGQSETAVSEMCDACVLLLLPAGGDELQGIKRGVLETADFVLVNKADGELARQAAKTVAEYASALRYLRTRSSSRTTPVRACSALTGEGMADIWRDVREFHRQIRNNGALAQLRSEQARQWLWAEVSESLREAFRANAAIAARLPELEVQVGRGEVTPSIAARELIDSFITGRNS